MPGRNKVELFEEIRRAFAFEGKSVRKLAESFGVHRRTVRQALKDAVPPPRKSAHRKRPRLDPVGEFIDRILLTDVQAPRKQRHTAHRIYQRLGAEFPEHPVAESTVRRYVRERKHELGLIKRDVCIPQSYEWGVEAQVDWYEAEVEHRGEREKLQFFAMRSMAGGAAFHRAYPRATQQAFLDAHQLAFHYFGGVFRRLRYDNLSSAVKKILRGSRREETSRFITFRSHWQYEASFCNPGEGHEKGGVEGEVGYFRRNHLVPVPRIESLDEFNQQLLEWCREDYKRVIGPREISVGVALDIERPHLMPLQTEDFEITEELCCRVDGKGCVLVRTNWYSTPLRPGLQVRVRVRPAVIEIWHEGQVVTTHDRSWSRRQQILDLEHYLDVLERKPGALAGSTPLQQWRAAGRWTLDHDRFLQELQRRQGMQTGSRLMIELLQLGRQHGYQRLRLAIEHALAAGAVDVAAVRYLLLAPELEQPLPPTLLPSDVKRLDYYSRPLPELNAYDQLLEVRA